MTIAALWLLNDTHKRDQPTRVGMRRGELSAFMSGRQQGKSRPSIRMLSEFLKQGQKPEPKYLSGKYPK